MRTLLTAVCLALAFASPVSAKTKKKKIKKPAVPAFSAKSYLVADSDGTILKEHDMHEVLPIASISKLMVALIASGQSMIEDLSIPQHRQVHSSIPKSVTTLTRKELLTLALVRSDNLAAQVLCENIDGCVDLMNAKASELGMEHTHYVEPTGLSPENTSTANDLLKLMLAARENEILRELSSLPVAEIETDGKPIVVRNTNPLTRKFDVVLSKTGFTNPAGGCLVMIMNSDIGPRILILLGSRNARTRIPDMERLIKGLNGN